MPKGHRGVGSYIGAAGSYATGGFFTSQAQQKLMAAGGWKKPIDIIDTGLQLYLDAKNTASYSGSGTTWYDISGNNRNLTWSSGPSFTSGSIPYFSTSGYSASGPASNSFGINNTSGYTIFVVFYNNALVNNGAFTFYSTGGTGGDVSRGIFSHLPWSTGDIYLDQGGCCNPDQRVSTAMTNSTGAWNVIGFRCNPSTERSIWQNGTKKVSNTTAAANINLSSTAMNINGSSDYGTSWNARLSQFVVYNRALSDAEMVSVNDALKVKVGL